MTRHATARLAAVVAALLTGAACGEREPPPVTDTAPGAVVADTLTVSDTLPGDSLAMPDTLRGDSLMARDTLWESR